MTARSDSDAVAAVLRAKRANGGSTGSARKGGSAAADPKAREHLRRADPILRELIDARPGFDPRAWLDELPGDLALRRAIQHAYAFDQPPTEDEMVELAERWRPHRSLAASYLLASEFEKGT